MSSVTRGELSVIALALLHVLVADAGPIPIFAMGHNGSASGHITGMSDAATGAATSPVSATNSNALPFTFNAFDAPAASRARLLITHHLATAGNGQTTPHALYRNPRARQVCAFG